MPSKLASRSIACIFQSSPRTGTARPVIRSTSPGGGDASIKTRSRPVCDFNPRPPCGGRQQAAKDTDSAAEISIHAPRAGGDLVAADAIHISVPISIHAPRVGGRHYKVSADYILGIFQSTPPMRGATCFFSSSVTASIFQSTPPCGGRRPGAAAQHRESRDFNPRPPCGGRQSRVHRSRLIRPGISIHAPRVGGDPPKKLGAGAGLISIHAPPCGGRPRRSLQKLRCQFISIHAPRAGGDWVQKCLPHQWRHFNPRPRAGGDGANPSPCGRPGPYFNPRPPVWGATIKFLFTHRISKFQSTPPMRGATAVDLDNVQLRQISIHAPHAGGDSPATQADSRYAEFQSTPPVRGATVGEFFLIASKWQPFVGLTFGV